MEVGFVAVEEAQTPSGKGSPIIKVHCAAKGVGGGVSERQATFTAPLCRPHRTPSGINCIICPPFTL
ncbi:hypothetical protein HanRHA438_Chr14g0633521 [Helianthus annuus]|nr:hypothetical protein HanRHA438_Chr14g0633521 [Helianthus annuus]